MAKTTTTFPLSALRKAMDLSYFNFFKMRSSHLILQTFTHSLTYPLKAMSRSYELKTSALNTCTRRYLCLAAAGWRTLLLVSDNANETTPSTVFNPAWAWLGAVVAILLLATAFVLIRKFKHGTRNTTNEDDLATNSEAITGYTRFWNRHFSYKASSYKNWKANVTIWKLLLTKT